MDEKSGAKHKQKWGEGVKKMERERWQRRITNG